MIKAILCVLNMSIWHLLLSNAFTIPPAKRLLFEVVPEAKTRIILGVSSSTTPGIGSSKVDGWSDFNVNPGTPVDINVMEVVGSDYSNNCPIDTVVRCEKAGVNYDGTLTQRAQIIASLGPEPPELAGSSGSFSLSKEEKEFELAENEYTVNGGTKIDRTRMYVLTFEKSQREGGTVIRTLKPGLLSPDGSTINLAEVIASSGPNGDWKEDRNAERTFKGGSIDGNSIGGSESSNDWSSGRESKGMVAFSSGRLGPPGGPGRQDGYTYGPTPKKSSSLSQSYQAEGKSNLWSMPGSHQAQPQQNRYGNGQSAYSQSAYSSYSNSTDEVAATNQFGVGSSAHNKQRYPHEQPYGRPFGEQGAFPEKEQYSTYSNQPQSDDYNQPLQHERQGLSSRPTDNLDTLRQKFEQLGDMLNDVYKEQSSNEKDYNYPYGQQPTYGQVPQTQAIASGLDEIVSSLQHIRSRPTPPGEIEKLQTQIEQLRNMIQSSNRGSEELQQKLSDLTARSQKWDISLEKMRNFLSRRKGRVSSFRHHLDQVLAHYIACENEIMNLIEDSCATTGSTMPKETYGGNEYATANYDINAASATDPGETNSYWAAKSSSTEGTDYSWNMGGSSSTTQETNYGSSYTASTTDDTFGAVDSAYTSSASNDTVGAIPHWASTWGEKTYQQLEQQQIEMDKEQQWNQNHWGDNYASSSENTQEGHEGERKQENKWGQAWQPAKQEEGREQDSTQTAGASTSYSPFGSHQTKEDTKTSYSPFGASQTTTETKPSYSSFGASETAGTASSFSPFGSGNANWAGQSSSSSKEQQVSEVKQEQKWVPRWQKNQQQEENTKQAPSEEQTKKTKSVFSLFRSNLKKNATTIDALEAPETQSTTAAAPPAASAPAFSGFGHTTIPLGPNNSPFNTLNEDETQSIEETQQTVVAAAHPATLTTSSPLDAKSSVESLEEGEEAIIAKAPPVAVAASPPLNTEPIQETPGGEESVQGAAGKVPPVATAIGSQLSTKPIEETRATQETHHIAENIARPAATVTNYLDGL